MYNKSLLLELLVSGFFAIACLKARAGDFSQAALSPRNFLRLTDRLDRLSHTRWQWATMVLLLVLVRLQSGVPLTVELTALAQFAIFLALPVAETAKVIPTTPIRSNRSGTRRRAHSAS